MGKQKTSSKLQGSALFIFPRRQRLHSAVDVERKQTNKITNEPTHKQKTWDVAFGWGKTPLTAPQWGEEPEVTTWGRGYHNCLWRKGGQTNKPSATASALVVILMMMAMTHQGSICPSFFFVSSLDSSSLMAHKGHGLFTERARLIMSRET